MCIRDRNCTLDSWSQGKTVYLESDIDLTGVDFSPIPTFGGTFEGQGYTISGLSLTDSGNVQGLFRYIQPAGIVRDLNITGGLTPVSYTHLDVYKRQIIMLHRFLEEREHAEERTACIAAVAAAIPAISASSLTTISGLAAMMFMQFRIGFDMGIVLIKAILFSMLSVFTLMPGLLMLFSKAMAKTQHRSFIPQIDRWGKLSLKLRYVGVPPVSYTHLDVYKRQKRLRSYWG